MDEKIIKHLILEAKKMIWGNKAFIEVNEHFMKNEETKSGAMKGIAEAQNNIESSRRYLEVYKKFLANLKK